MKLKPVVIIGQKGLSENVQNEIDGALTHHELVKLRLPALDRVERRELCEQLCHMHSATLVEAIGGIAVFYRRNPDTDRFASLLKS
ncbi:MAG TPA: YhbY family RNA-binding protein [Gammaproteobacteria bacterium]